MNSTELIGRARERWNEIDHEDLDWISFFNGWLEGRADVVYPKKEAGMTKADMKEMLAEYLMHIRDHGALPNGTAGHRHFTFDDLHKGAEEFLAQFQDDSGA